MEEKLKDNTKTVDNNKLDLLIEDKPLEDKKKKRQYIKRKDKTGIDDNLLKKVAPMLAASFISVYARDLLEEKYKACAPTKEETLSILEPLFAILSRNIQITSQLSQTILDIIASVIAASTFSIRSYMTYSMIKENEKQYEKDNEQHTKQSSEEPRISPNGRGDTTQFVSKDDFPYSDELSTEDGRGGYDIVTQLLERDRVGRAKYGLI